jgi:hypothetical protein
MVDDSGVWTPWEHWETFCVHLHWLASEKQLLN